jgi:hypothetical protein
LRVQATNSPGSFEVTTDGAGVVGHAGAALLRELADRLGLTRALGWHQPGGQRRHPDAAVLRDLAVMLADGGDCLSDLAVLRDQPGLFGQVASTPTAWRVVERVATDADGLARLRAARAHARARAWAAGGDPDVELLIIDADATLVLAHSDHKEGRCGHLQAQLRVRAAAGLPGPRGLVWCPAAATTFEGFLVAAASLLRRQRRRLPRPSDLKRKLVSDGTSRTRSRRVREWEKLSQPSHADAAALAEQRVARTGAWSGPD